MPSRKGSAYWLQNDHEINKAEWIVYDALYAYCEEMIRRGKPNGAFR